MITAKIDKYGNIDIDVNGIKGESCVTKTNELLKYVSGKTDKTEKPEMYMNEELYETNNEY